jgi:hypothetical protein
MINAHRSADARTQPAEMDEWERATVGDGLDP